VLTGGFGAGAKGVYALDVTDPTAFAASSVLWEFTANDDPDIGHVTGKPLIAPLMLASGARWFVVVSSGYDYYRDGTSSDTAVAHVFFLSLDKAAKEVWVEGTNYYKVALPFDAAALGPIGASQAGGVFDRLGALTTLYLGDLRGNLWKIDVSDRSVQNWNVAFGATPLFVAADGNGNRQPIMAAPSVAFGPGKGYLVSFGTGRLLAGGDNLARAVAANVTAFDQQTFFTIWDDLASPVTSRSALAARTATVSAGSGTVGGSHFTYDSSGSGKRGWYLDLPDATAEGERVANAAVLSYGRVFFNTIVPGADPCASGQSRSYGLDLMYGLGNLYGSSSGYLATPLVLRTGLVKGVPDPTAFRSDRMDSALIQLGTTGQSVQRQPSINVQSGAWNWRELTNWRDLRRTSSPPSE
jgi:type IV pilus assembly protein PilY1